MTQPAPEADASTAPPVRVDHEHDVRQLDRLTFFSDAVFAIAMTLLVIEVRLPTTAHPETDRALSRALLDLIPHYIGFLVSFVVIGRFWVGHHRIFGLLARTSNKLIWRNLFLLITVAFMPFPTAVLSESPGLRVSVLFYAGWLLVMGIAHRVLVQTALVRPGLVRDDVSEVECSYLRRGSWIPSVIAMISLVAASISSGIGILVLMFVSPIVSWALHRNQPRPDTDD